MKQLIVIQHLEGEGLGTLEPILSEAGISVCSIRTFAGEKVPDRLGASGGLIVLGGSFGVYDSEEYPFLLDEIRLIESALREDKPILGICLGSQLLASALGAKVYKSGRQEIGWHLVALSEAAKTDYERVQDVYDSIGHNESGLALEILCENLYEFDCPIPQRAYNLLEESGTAMKIDSKYWETLKPLIIS